MIEFILFSESCQEKVEKRFLKAICQLKMLEYHDFQTYYNTKRNHQKLFYINKNRQIIYKNIYFI